MKHKLKTGAQILAVTAAFALLASVTFAYTNPTGSAPSGNVPAPVNTGSVMQTKLGDLGLAGTGTGNLFAAMNGFFGGGVFANSGVFAAGAHNFTSTTSLLYAGLPFAYPPIGFSVDATGNTKVTGLGLTVDLTHNSGSLGRNVLYLNGSSDNTHVAISTNLPGVHFWSSGTNSDAGILAGYGFFKGSVTIQDGTQGAGKVLTSDASGNASWQTASSTYTPSVTYVHADAPAQVTTSSVTCPSGTVLVGGGGACDNAGGANYPLQRSSFNTSNTNEWDVACAGNGANPAAHSYAVCLNLPPAAPSGPTTYYWTTFTSANTSFNPGTSYAADNSNHLKFRTSTNGGSTWQNDMCPRGWFPQYNGYSSPVNSTLTLGANYVDIAPCTTNNDSISDPHGNRWLFNLGDATPTFEVQYCDSPSGTCQ